MRPPSRPGECPRRAYAAPSVGKAAPAFLGSAGADGSPGSPDTGVTPAYGRQRRPPRPEATASRDLRQRGRLRNRGVRRAAPFAATGFTPASEALAHRATSAKAARRQRGQLGTGYDRMRPGERRCRRRRRMRGRGRRRRRRRRRIGLRSCAGRARSPWKTSRWWPRRGRAARAGADGGGERGRRWRGRRRDVGDDDRRGRRRRGRRRGRCPGAPALGGIGGPSSLSPSSHRSGTAPRRSGHLEVDPWSRRLRGNRRRFGGVQGAPAPGKGSPSSAGTTLSVP